MTATDELRRMLDERGVKWVEFIDPTATAWTDGTHAFTADEYEDGKLELCCPCCTSERAIAVTLGTGTCHITREPGSDRLWYCDHCKSYHDHHSDYAWEFCPRCGAKAVKE